MSEIVCVVSPEECSFCQSSYSNGFYPGMCIRSPKELLKMQMPWSKQHCVAIIKNWKQPKFSSLGEWLEYGVSIQYEILCSLRKEIFMEQCQRYITLHKKADCRIKISIFTYVHLVSLCIEKQKQALTSLGLGNFLHKVCL